MQVQASDFEFLDGKLVSRQECNGDQTCPESLFSTTESQYVNMLTSEASDDAVLEMKKLTIWQDEETFISLNIQGSARVREAESIHGTVVLYYTTLGKLKLDNTSISTDDSLAQVFSDAGFQMESHTGTRAFGGNRPPSMNSLNLATPVLGFFQGISPSNVDAFNVIEKPRPTMGGRSSRNRLRPQLSAAGQFQLKYIDLAKPSSGVKDDRPKMGGVGR